MKVKSDNKNVFILFWIFLIVATSSCNSQSQSNKKNQIVQTKTDSKLLKYKTGVVSILEDSKGNIWFGSYNEGVCLLHNGEFQYFTTENGLSNNGASSIYEDKNGIIWFECGESLSTYDGQNMAIYKEINYDSTTQWKLNDSDLWFKGNKRLYNKFERNTGIYQFDGKKLHYRTFTKNIG